MIQREDIHIIKVKSVIYFQHMNQLCQTLHHHSLSLIGAESPSVSIRSVITKQTNVCQVIIS